MISFIRGRIVDKNPASLLIENQGIGFHLHIPVSSYKRLGGTGDEAQILTYLHVREDALQLFGFATEDERQLFLYLISVSGIGPKLAIGILSGISADDFIRAVLERDIVTLTGISGVGKKTAERLALELKDKVGKGRTFEEGVSGISKSRSSDEALKALLTLGFKQKTAEEAIKKIIKDDSSLPVEMIVKKALQRM